ncbi:MAG: aminotransferase class I/II-fold pyridoxal phosphate-dependent enzyme [Bacteroidetes bacterium]|nr:aminotransferase class I/II-fold pyridoxal phosphate-dependent enzyme [Bacteroidota bacterium]
MIDLRSDTVTRPSREMLEAMFSAKVGDDVFHDDPTVIMLEEKAACMLGKEAALFCPSGTMTNQIAVNIHTRPGDEVICHKHSHVYYYEGGSMMRNSGVSVCLLEGERGQISASDVAAHINPDTDVHRPVTTLVEVENTMNKGGGSVYKYESLKEIAKVCRDNNLKYHLDGARLFNALAETGESPEKYAQLFDSVSICLSKGLGAPIGSLIIGDRAFIKRARRVRKAFGGAMRQVGYIAAAGIYALDHNISRLKQDHIRACYLGNLLETMPYIDKVMPAETNILIFTLNVKYSDKDFLSELKEKDILAVPMGQRMVRFVTHLDFTDSMMMKVEEVLKSL